jgi:histone deacetylase complex subunit SAP18
VQEFDRLKNLARDEAQIYTWRDATLREITELIKALNPAARARYAQISFALVYPSKSGMMTMRNVGECYGDSRSGRDDNKTLDELHFETGDYLDVAILVNNY